MATYNEEKNIRKSIDSIISQSYENWELIICDDCSSDNTVSIIKEYQRKDNRIHLIVNDKNIKLAASLNKCLKLCKGAYVARMDADDECLPNRFEVQISFFMNNDSYDVVGTAALINDETGCYKIRRMKEIPTKNDVLLGPVFIHPSIMMKTKVYRELGGYSVLERTTKGQDWDLWFRFFAKNYCGYNLQEPLLIYHEDKNDYKKRTFKTSMKFFKTALFGFKLIKPPFYKWILVFKPVVSFFVPNCIKKKIHNKRVV